MDRVLTCYCGAFCSCFGSCFAMTSCCQHAYLFGPASTSGLNFGFAGAEHNSGVWHQILHSSYFATFIGESVGFKYSFDMYFTCIAAVAAIRRLSFASQNQCPLGSLESHNYHLDSVSLLVLKMRW